MRRRATAVRQRGHGTLPANNASTSETKRKRVYKSVSVTDAAGAFSIALDDKSLHTPGRAILATACEALAVAIAAEWDAQKETIDPATMPLTKLLNTAIDRVAPFRNDVVSELLRYVDTDMLCYRAEAPDSLVERQEKVWQPVLDWLAEAHIVALQVGQGMMPLSQSKNDISRTGEVLMARDDLNLTAVQAAAALTGSLALALALAEAHLTGEEVFAAAQLDETWQMERWGEDGEAMERRKNLQSDLRAAERFLALSR